MELWIIWLVAALLLGVGEMHARGFVLAPLALGALVAAGASLAGLGAALSVIVFLVLSIVVLRALRPLALRHQSRPMSLRTGAAALVGVRAVVVERIANDESVGSVRINAELWTARSFDDGVVIGAGAVVEVLAIRGATALVEAAVLKAEGAREAAILRADGEAKAITIVFSAIHDGDADTKLLSYQYLRMLPELARGDANKVFVIPSEFTQAFADISSAVAGRADTARANG